MRRQGLEESKRVGVILSDGVSLLRCPGQNITRPDAPIGLGTILRRMCPLEATLSLDTDGSREADLIWSGSSRGEGRTRRDGFRDNKRVLKLGEGTSFPHSVIGSTHLVWSCLCEQSLRPD